MSPEPSLTIKEVVGKATPVANGKEAIEYPTPAEQAIEQVIFGLGWKDRMEIREMAEKDAGLVSLTQAIKEFREKVAGGDYRANFPTFRKFWNNTLSTNTLRAPALMTELPEYQRNIKWAT